MDELIHYSRQGPDRLSRMIVVTILIIAVIQAFFLPLGFSQDKPTQSIQDLYKNPKIKFPEAVFQTFITGADTSNRIFYQAHFNHCQRPPTLSVA